MQAFLNYTTTTQIIIVCAIILVLLLIQNPLRLLFTFLKQAVVGALIMTGLNFALAPFSIFVGLNGLTLTVAGVLGVPGLISLYLIQLLFI